MIDGTIFNVTRTDANVRQRRRWPSLLSSAAIVLAASCPDARAGLHSGAQYDALISLYNSTNGALWTSKTGWGAGDACGWYGIGCDQDGTPADNTSNVISIELISNNLTGTLSPLAGLPSLQTVEIVGNPLTGSIPSLTGLSNLRTFIAYFNHLTGSIPSLTGLTNLQYFQVDVNQLTGSLPALAGLTSLVAFAASRNQLTGSIPALSGLTSLSDFEIQNNQIAGSIPALTGLNSLQAFKVDTNQLTGMIPPAPEALVQATLCPNPLDTTPSVNDAAWNTATGFTPWWANPYPNNNCDDTFTNGFGG